MKRIIVLMLLIMSGTAMSQSFSVSEIDTTNFPLIKAKYFALDSNGNQIKNLSAADFDVKENGTPRTVNNVTYPLDQPLQAVSIAMSFDVSWSMIYSDFRERPIDLSKIAAEELCKAVSIPQSEFALQTCDTRALIIQDFTKEKDKIINAIATVRITGEDNFAENLLNKLTGLLNIAKSGKNKKIAVMFTDAWWYALTSEELQQCKDTCAKYDIQFYAIVFSRSKSKPNGIQESLQELANATGGYLYDGILSDSVAKNTANTIAQTAQGVEPSEITWQSDYSCRSSFVNTEIKIIPHNQITNLNYLTPNSAIAKLEFNPPTIRFKNPKIGEIVLSKYK